MIHYSVLIFTKNEHRTIRKAIESIRQQKGFQDYEVLVVAPDEKTKQIVEEVQSESGILNGESGTIRFVQDRGKGKPAAINLAVQQAQGDILVLTDGDVFIDHDALHYLLRPFIDSYVGATTGRPFPQDSRDTKYGYWAHVLTQAGAHRIRMQQQKKGGIIECSAYLMAIRKNLVDPIPEDALTDDPILSRMVWSKNHSVVYAPKARVYVKYPTNFHDWKLQKVRSVAGYYQGYLGKDTMRSAKKEAARVRWVLTYPRTIREFIWTIELVFARLYIWFAAMWKIKVQGKDFHEMWKRVESTK